MTFIGVNPDAQRHDVPGHPETAKRAQAIEAAFAKDGVASKLARLRPDRALSRDEALLVHTPRLFLNLENIHKDGGSAYLDPDTYMVPGSFPAAVTTARLCQQAAVRALKDDEPGFVVARPPGHHATRDRSMGFCLLNNVALAARHALDHGAKRVLVFDHDVHHGNGTQDIFYESDQVLYQSFHLAPHYPGTGDEEELGRGAGVGFTMNARLEHGEGDAAVRSLLANVFLPAAKEFKPDLVLFSSGFDSLEGDPLGGLRLSVPFYAEMVQRYRRVCPRLVAVLEGGYQVDQIPRAALGQVHALAGDAVDEASEMQRSVGERRLGRALDGRWSSVGRPAASP